MPPAKTPADLMRNQCVQCLLRPVIADQADQTGLFRSLALKRQVQKHTQSDEAES